MSNDYAKPHDNIMLRSNGELLPFPLHVPKLAGKRTINHPKTVGGLKPKHSVRTFQHCVNISRVKERICG